MLKFGVSMSFTGYSMAPGELAVELEQRGFESVWSGDHSHIPVATEVEFASDGGIPRHVYDVMDPFVTLSAAAMATKTLKIGTGACLIAQRDPIQTAKLVASIDQVSGGRFLFGVDSNGNREEMENHGTDYGWRHRRARKSVEAMKQIWTQPKAEYHGQFVNFGPMMAWPKPVQEPHPPVLVCGHYLYSARRAMLFGDGWMPWGASEKRNLVGPVQRFRQMGAEGGHDTATIPVTAWYPPRSLGLLHRYHELGMDRAVFIVPSAKADIVLPALDEIGALMAAVNW